MQDESKKRALIFAISFIGLFVMTFLVVNEHANAFDNIIYSSINAFASAQMTLIVQVITMLGSPLVITAFAMILLALNRNRSDSLYVIFMTAITYLFNYGYMNFVMRPIPSGIHMVALSGFSFPSEYMSLAIVFYGLVFFYVGRSIKNDVVKITLIVIYSFLIAAIGASRIYLGASHFTDVIASLFIVGITNTVILFLADLMRIIANQTTVEEKKYPDDEVVEDLITD